MHSELAKERNVLRAFALQKYKSSTQSNAGQGNCLYLSVLQLLRHRQETVSSLRELAVEYLHKNREDFIGGVERQEGESWDDAWDRTVNIHLEDGEFGEGIIVGALAQVHTHMQTHTHTHTRTRTHTHTHTHRHLASRS